MKFGNSSITSLIKIVLDVAWYLVMVVAVLQGLLLIYGIVNPGAELDDAVIRVPCNVEALSITWEESRSDEFSATDTPITSRDPAIYGYNLLDTAGSLQFRTRSRTSLGIYLMTVLFWIGIVLFILGNLRKIFASLKIGSPFILENALRLRRIGVTVALMPPAAVLLRWIFDRVVLRGTFSLLGEPLSVALWPDEGVTLIVLGLMVLAISEVFRLGVQMKEDLEKLREDQSLTV